MPSPAMGYSIFALTLLMWLAAPVYGSSECVNATLPNILNLEQCLGTSLELCSGSMEDVVAAVGKVVQCLAVELVTINPLSALSALIDIVLIVVGALGSVLGSLTDIIDPLCAAAAVDGCTTLLTGGETCMEPIHVTLPSSLNFGQCLTDTLQVCQDGELATDEVLTSLVQALACLLNNFMESDPDMVMNTMACPVLYVVQAAASVNIGMRLTLGFAVTAIQAITQC